MGFEYVSKLPTPDEIRAQFPLAPALAAEKARKDEVYWKEQQISGHYRPLLRRPGGLRV